MVLGCTDSVNCESAVMVAVGGRIVSGAEDIGVMALKERYIVAFSPNIFWLDGYF